MACESGVNRPLLTQLATVGALLPTFPPLQGPAEEPSPTAFPVSMAVILAALLAYLLFTGRVLLPNGRSLSRSTTPGLYWTVLGGLAAALAFSVGAAVWSRS